MHRMAGFTLIEMLVALVILAILVFVALPNFTMWIQNTKIRTTAQDLLNGLQLARAEALRRNARVELALTDAEPMVANVGALPVTSGRNWIVRVNTGGAYTAADFIQGGGVSVTGATNAQMKADRETSSAPGSSDVDTVIFGGLGQATAVSEGDFPLFQVVSIQVTNPAGGACAAAGGSMRCLTVQATIGGQVRLCDPALATFPANPQGCPLPPVGGGPGKK